jgi:hypothetical protein
LEAVHLVETTAAIQILDNECRERDDQIGVLRYGIKRSAQAYQLALTVYSFGLKAGINCPFQGESCNGFDGFLQADIEYEANKRAEVRRVVE